MSRHGHGNVVELVVRRAAVEPLRRGHPWLFREQIESTRGTGTVGCEVRVVDSSGACLGRGIFTPESAIAVRMWTHEDRPVDLALITQRVRAAQALRARVFDDAKTDAYRLVNGEGDRMPGIVLDRYGDVGVLRTDGDGAEAQVGAIAPVLVDVFGGELRSLVHRVVEKGKPPRATVLHGAPAPDTIVVREHGVPFVVDLAQGQKTGAFLDQRENRKRVGAMAKGKRVLNLFSYAGGFSLHAALGGAASVTSVDVAAKAHATAQASFRAAGVETKGHEFVTADVFAFLESAAKKARVWDLVISDPPSFAPNERSLGRALAAYRTLHRACVSVLAPGGTFCASSCSSHVHAEDFVGTLDDDALGGSELRLVELYGPPPDHPTLPVWPEGRYLKFAVLT